MAAEGKWHRPTDFDEHQYLVLQAQVSVSALLSILGSSGILLSMSLEEKPWTPAERLVKHLVAILSVIDLFSSCAFMLGQLLEEHPLLCRMQGFFIQWLALAGILWNCSMSLNLLCWIVLKKPVPWLRSLLKYYMIISLGLCLVLAFSLLYWDMYGPHTLWCWIDTENQDFRFGCFYFILLVAWLFNGCVFGIVIRAARKQRSIAGQQAARYLRVQLLLMIISFILTWTFGLLNRALQRAGINVFWANLLHGATEPLQGFWNALLFGAFHGCLRWQTPQRGCTSASGRKGSKRNPTADMSIFAVSYNLGEAELATVRPLGRWIPRGHDVYALSLQEVTIPLDELQAAVVEHLSYGGPRYVAFRQTIGSTNTQMGFHGKIVVFVFARASDVASGKVVVPKRALHDTVKAGTKVGPYVASNKGIVGMPLRIYNSTMAVIGGHLVADRCGQVRFTRRNRMLEGVLRSLVLTDVDASLDAHLMFHHTLLLGDLNYRIRKAPEHILDLVAEAAQAEQLGLHLQGCELSWTLFRYARLLAQPQAPGGGQDDWSVPQCEGFPTYEEPSGEAGEYWDELMRVEELTAAMEADLLLHGFEESPIRFPPSFRRRTGAKEGDCKDYTDKDILSQAYVTRVQDVSRATSKAARYNHMVSPEGYSLRPPSYTDRILLHSLEDCRSRISCSAYELCDAATGSDHRPVAAVFKLHCSATELFDMGNGFDRQPSTGSQCFVEAETILISVSAVEAVLYLPAKAPFHRSSSCADSEEHSDSDEEDNLEEMEGTSPLRLLRTFTGTGGGEWREEMDRADRDSPSHCMHHSSSTATEVSAVSEPGSSRIPARPVRIRSNTSLSGKLTDRLHRSNVTLTFPLPPEDPLGSSERHVLIAAEMSLGHEDELLEFQVSKPFCALAFQGEELRLPAKACVALGLHAGISITDENGKSVGQAVLCLKEIMKTPGGTCRVDVPLTTGGVLRGHLSAEVSVDRLGFAMGSSHQVCVDSIFSSLKSEASYEGRRSRSKSETKSLRGGSWRGGSVMNVRCFLCSLISPLASNFWAWLDRSR